LIRNVLVDSQGMGHAGKDSTVVFQLNLDADRLDHHHDCPSLADHAKMADTRSHHRFDELGALAR
jgi:hypothetical protein